MKFLNKICPYIGLQVNVNYRSNTHKRVSSFTLLIIIVCIRIDIVFIEALAYS